MRKSHTIALRTAAFLWIIWGLVHVLAAFLIIPTDPGTAIGNIADAVDKTTLLGDYPEPLSGILSQHGWNLGWIGVTTIIGAILIWHHNMTAIWVTSLIGGMADIGYFVFIDLPGFANFLPGTMMTIFSALAILLGGWVWLSNRTKNTAS